MTERHAEARIEGTVMTLYIPPDGSSVMINRTRPPNEWDMHDQNIVLRPAQWEWVREQLVNFPSPPINRAKVSTYGGGGYVRHWQLHVDGRFIADTSIPADGDLYERIATALNNQTTKLLASIATSKPLVERAHAAIVRLRAGFWDRLENADLIEELVNALEDR